MSEDIDPASTDAVLWSLAYRSNPIEDVHLAPYRRGVQGSQYGPKQAESTMLIDATHKRPMPPLALPTRELHGARARALGGARPAGAQRPGAVARLYARRLDRRRGSASRSARPPATGSRTASRRSRASAAASRRKRRCARATRWRIDRGFPWGGSRPREGGDP